MFQNLFDPRRLSNLQLEIGLVASMIIIAIASFVQNLEQTMLLIILALTPFVLGFVAQVLFHYLDMNIESEVTFSAKKHAVYALFVSIIVASVLKNLTTQIPLIPLNTVTEAALAYIAPKGLIFVLAAAATLAGYYISYKATDEDRQGG